MSGGGRRDQEDAEARDGESCVQMCRLSASKGRFWVYSEQCYMSGGDGQSRFWGGGTRQSHVGVE